MTHLEAAAVVGKAGRLVIESGKLEVMVRITDVRERFGCDDYHVVPLCGFGDMWASADRVHILPGDQ